MCKKTLLWSLMLMLVAMLAFAGCGSDDDSTDGDVTDGDVTDGDTTDGDTTDGDVTDGDVEDGDVEDGDVEDGDVEDGDVEDGDVEDGDVEDGDVTDGDVTDGDVTDGDVTDGDVTDGDVTDGDVTDGDVTDGDVTDGDVTDGDEDGITVTIQVQNIAARNGVANLEVTLLDPETGEPVDGLETKTTDETGHVAYFIPESLGTVFTVLAVDVSENRIYVDTYTNALPLDTFEAWSVFIIPEVLYNLFVSNPETGTVMGNIRNSYESTDVVGCASVTLDSNPDAPVMYVNDALQPVADRTTTLPDFGAFAILGLTPGADMVRAFIGETEVGSASFFTYAGAATLTTIISSMPTPDDCE